MSMLDVTLASVKEVLIRSLCHDLLQLRLDANSPRNRHTSSEEPGDPATQTPSFLPQQDENEDEFNDPCIQASYRIS